MANDDDDQYWVRGYRPETPCNRPKFTTIKRPVPLTREIAENSKNAPRAKFVSPYLAEWLAKNPNSKPADVKLPDWARKKPDK